MLTFERHKDETFQEQQWEGSPIQTLNRMIKEDAGGPFSRQAAVEIALSRKFAHQNLSQLKLSEGGIAGLRPDTVNSKTKALSQECTDLWAFPIKAL